MNEKKSHKDTDISADRPGTDPSLDRLGYAPLAKRLAQSITSIGRAEGHVLALYGRWGFGKTTMLNYVRHYLSEIAPDEGPIVVPFNPWWFSGHEDLVRAFFAQFSAKIGDRKEFASHLRNHLADFAEALSDTPLPYANWGKLAGRVLRPKVKDVEALKNEISTALGAQSQRILVVIDDIDRLTSEEIRQVFRAVKSVGDFPNVTYLLAFEKEVVARSLSELQGGSGEDYLEKIVQVPFELPFVDRVSIRGLFFERLDPILAGVDSKNFDQTYWGNIFLEGIDLFLESPRDVVRLTNALAVTFPAVMGEVNPVDFVAIESFRIFCPEVYDAIRKDREMFVGHGAVRRYDRERDGLLQFHNGWLQAVHERAPALEEPIKHMIQRLFPKLQGVWGNMQFGPEWEAEWRRDLRVCSNTAFPVYFSLTIPAWEISNAEMQAILASAGNSQEFGNHMLKLAEEIRPDGKARAHEFLVRLQDYTSGEITIEQIEPIVLALLDVGDQLMRPEDQSAGLFDLGIDVQCGRVIWQLLKRLDTPRRFEMLRKGFEGGRALYVIQKSFIVLAQQQGLYGEQSRPEQEWFVTRDQLSELEKILVERIRSASEDGSLLLSPRPLLLLSFWAEKGGEAAARRLVVETVNDDARLAEFLERCLHSTASARLGDAVGRRHDRLDPHWFEKYIDVEELAGRVQKFSKRANLSERQRRAADQLLKEYELRKRGKNPDDRFTVDEP